MKATYCSVVGRACNRPGLCPRYLGCPHPDRCQTPPPPPAPKPTAAKPKAKPKVVKAKATGKVTPKKSGQVPRNRSKG